ncbi:MAG: DNA-binding domain-containing protein [Sphingomonadales bacterium]|nr:DNA-binding domain-containing protein [Sphingomonadales bacterium]
MPRLAELQADFSMAIRGAEAGPVAAAIVADGLTAAERINIHCNNMRGTLTDALALTFPVVQKLVGEGFFRYAAAEFIAAHPPRSGAILAYGGELAGFLAAFPPALSLPYLADVARLEWAINECYHGPDAGRLDRAALGDIPPDRLGEIRLHLPGNHRIVASAYPIGAIWQANQDGAEDGAIIDLDAGGDEILVIRPEMEVQVRILTAGEAALLGALAAGETLGSAAEAALEAEPEFDLFEALPKLLAVGTFDGFEL